MIIDLEEFMRTDVAIMTRIGDRKHPVAVTKEMKLAIGKIVVGHIAALANHAIESSEEHTDSTTDSEGNGDPDGDDHPLATDHRRPSIVERAAEELDDDPDDDEITLPHYSVP